MGSVTHIAPRQRKTAQAFAGASSNASTRHERLAQAALLVLLYAVPAIIAAHAAAVGDPDIWWHLRSGEWMMQHRAIPRTDPFSSFGAGKPWVAYSWLFDLLVSGAFHRFGLAGIVAYTSGTMLAITAAVHHLLRRLQQDFSVAILLTFICCFSIGHLYTPRPWLCSILFFVLELDILMHARRTGRTRELLWLPLIFALWANCHIQFVDGLLVCLLATAESLASYWLSRGATRVAPACLIAATVASIGATLCNPYGWRIYQEAHHLASQAGVMNKLQELQSPAFRDIVDWSVLALGVAAVAALARAGRPLWFESALLAFSGVLAFRSQRDVWLLAIAASAILASRIKVTRKSASQINASATPALVAMSAVLVLAVCRAMAMSNEGLQKHLNETLPVNAVAYSKAHGYAGPVFNDYGWGGYLIWELRQPVSIDGRAALHGDQRINRSDATWNGRQDWSSDPDLQAANLVIGPAQAPLSQLLRMDPQFQLAYEDKLATVFIRRRQ